LTGQFTQFADVDPIAQVYPAGQSVHWEAAKRSMLSDQVPAGQSTGVEEPAGQYFP